MAPGLGGGGDSERPVERFRPTTGLFEGYAGLALVVVGIGYVALQVPTRTGLQVGLGLAFAGVVVWTTQLRSRVTAYPSTLLLRNSLVDTVVPLHLVDEVSVRRVLAVYVGTRRYVCIGIGRSLRSLRKTSKRGVADVLGGNRLNDYVSEAARADPDATAASYETFVVTRIEELVRQAKSTARRSDADLPAEARRLVAWPEIAALLVTGAAFAASLLL
jgi:hypothetical protein